MATYVPAKKNTAYIAYVGLISQADTKLLQVNPTIAAGDFKVSIDGGSFNNLTTLPVVTPAGGRAVKIALSSSEMNGDNIFVQCVDAAGSEWCDLSFNIQTAARQIDDLTYPATSGRSMVVDVAGLVDANTVKVGPSGSGTAQTAGNIVADLSSLTPLDSGTAVAGGSTSITLRAGASSVDSYYRLNVVTITGGTGAGQARVITAYIGSTQVATVDRAWATNPDSSSTYSISGVAPKLNTSGEVVAASVTGAVASVSAGVIVTTNNDKTGYGLSSAGIQGIWDALTSALTTSGSIGKWIIDKLDVIVSTRLAATDYTAPSNSSIAAIKAKTDNLPASPAAVSDIPTANANADALLDRTAGIQTNWTPRQGLRVILAALSGKLSGAATTSVIIRDPEDTKDRITATVDSSGNRSAVTYDKS